MVTSNDIHPSRWLRTRPFARELINIFAKTAVGVGPTQTTCQQSTSAVFPHYNAALLKVPVSRRPSSGRLVQEEIGLGVHAARYFATGRNAFVLSPGLNQSLLHTDLTGLKFSDIHFPFRSFYLGFAGPIDASLPGSDNFIDGGYVCDLGSVIEVLLTTRRYDVDPSNSKRWPWSRDPYFYVPFEPGDSEETIENALTRLLKTRKIDIEPRDFIPDAVPMDLESTGFENAPFEVFDVTARNNAIDAARNIEALPSVRRALSLLLNAIA
jgi:hypothetical protein